MNWRKKITQINAVCWVFVLAWKIYIILISWALIHEVSIEKPHEHADALPQRHSLTQGVYVPNLKGL